MQYFADTTFLVALFNVKDAHHRKAVELMGKLAKEPARAPVMILSDYVFDEMLTTIRFRTHRHDVAAAAGKKILEARAVKILPVAPSTFDRAWQVFLKRPDKEWSFTDCTSFSLMEEMGLREALSFDSNFHEAGFVMHP